jgi:hypothetical protein
VSFPIEDAHSIVTAAEVRRGGKCVGELVEQLTGGRMRRSYRVHLNPDLDPSCYPRRPGWKSVLGQTGSSLGHLRKQGVGIGDLPYSSAGTDRWSGSAGRAGCTGVPGREWTGPASQCSRLAS